MKQVFKKNKIKYQNKKAVRVWLAGYRPEAYCEKIKTLRIRLKKLLSNYADCIDYHFFQNIADKIDTAIKAKNGEIWSQQHAITFVGNVDSVMDEIEQIKEEQADLILGYRFFCKILCFSTIFSTFVHKSKCNGFKRKANRTV